MSEYDPQELDAAFDDFRAAVTPHVRPAGIDAARATVRRRRHVQISMVVAFLVIAVSVPIVVFAGAGKGRQGPRILEPSPTTSAAPTATPPSTPSVGPSPSPSMPTVSDRTRCDKAGSVRVAPGGIGLSELCDATVDVPAWPGRSACPSGPTRFKAGAHFIAASTFVNIGASYLVSDAGVAYADIDNDGLVETFVLVSCGGESWVSQVVALRRAANGAIRTVGVVLHTGDAVQRIFGLAAGANGAIMVEVGDYNPGLGGNESLIQHQWRTFAFVDKAFSQTSGPTSFPPNSHLVDVAITTSNLAFGAPSKGQRTGKITITVRNLGPSSAPFSAVVSLPSYLSLVPVAGCTVRTFPQPVIDVVCAGEPMASGSSWARTLTFHAPADANTRPSTFIWSASVSVGDGYADPRYDDNMVDIAMVFG